MSFINVLKGKTESRYFDTVFKFFEVFNHKTGEYVRGESSLTGKDPFMRSFPNLLDIGIMGGCKSASLCQAGGRKSGCYQGGKPYDVSKNMKFEDFCRLIDEGAENGLQQVALGGAGNPEDHQDFEKIVRYASMKGVVPNYTTSGICLDDEKAEISSRYCGAVAVSWYRQEFTGDAIERFLRFGNSVSIHYVLSKETIDEAIGLLKNHILPYGDGKVFDFERVPVKAFLFLLYKPVGLGRKENCLGQEDVDKLKEFFYLASLGNHPFMVGFDSCSVPLVLKYSSNVDSGSLDTCEGGRFSAYVFPDMVMVPCSFDQSRKFGISLEGKTIEEVWNSDRFSKFRSSLFLSCRSCGMRDGCMGGCPLMRDLVICDSLEKFQI